MLLLEDREDVRELAAVLLGAAGYEVQTAGTVAEARTAWEARPFGFDAVVADAHLPDGHGFSFLQDVEQYDLTRILMSGDPYAIDTEVAREQGVRLLAKPFAVGALIDMLGRDSHALERSLS